jgi:hypothetical protein
MQLYMAADLTPAEDMDIGNACDDRVYLATEVATAMSQLIADRDDALVAHSELAVRAKELEQDNARWISARDVWTAEMKAKDERIRELEKALRVVATNFRAWQECFTSDDWDTWEREAIRALSKGDMQ